MLGINMTNSTKSAQLNVRMDEQLKQSGDAALASIGFSPSETIRIIWKKASLRGKDLEEVRRFLGKELTDTSTIVQQKDPFAPGRRAVNNCLRDIAIDIDTPASFSSSNKTDRELLDAALLERMNERELI